MNKLEETKEKFYNNKIVVVIMIFAAIIIGVSQLFQAIGGSVDTYNSLTEEEKTEQLAESPYRSVLLGSVVTATGEPLADYELQVFPSNYNSLKLEGAHFTLEYTTPIDSLYLEIGTARHLAQKYRLSMMQVDGDTLYRQFQLKKALAKAQPSNTTLPAKSAQTTSKFSTSSNVDLSNATVNGPIINQPTGNIVIESNYGTTTADTTRKN